MDAIPGAEGIPEWVFWISTAVGTGIGALIVRLGWRSGGHTPAPLKPEGTTYIDRVGVLVDNSTIQVLAGSIEGLGVELMAVRRDATVRSELNERLSDRLVEELNELRKDIRELARAYRAG